MALTQECIAAVTNALPTKLKDLGSFTIIPCSIRGVDMGNTLCDLGAIINRMPLSMFKRLGVGAARPTTMTL